MESAGAGLLASWKPHPRQELALTCPADEVFFGGAAGGGKSDFLLADFLYGINQGYRENYLGILFRRTYPEQEELIRRSFDMYLPQGGVFKDDKKEWTFPQGESLRFRFCEADKDVYRYQGHAYQWAGWDELPQYPTDFPYRYILSRIRSAHGVPCRIRASGNPGCVGHGWVKARWIDDRIAERIFVDEESLLSRCFIPSKLEDNPTLMLNDPKYEQRLKALPPNQYRALRLGDWDVFAGQVFGEFSRATHLWKSHELPGEIWGKWTSLDWGYAKPFSIGWWAGNADGVIIRYREMYGAEKNEPNVGVKRSSKDVAKEAWEKSFSEGATSMIADPACWGKTDDNPSVAEEFAAVGFNMIKADNARVPGLQRVHDLLKTKAQDGKPMLRIGNTCFNWLRTVPGLTADPNHPEDVDTRLEDHAYDETRYGLLSAYAKSPSMLIAKANRPLRRKTEYKIM